MAADEKTRKVLLHLLQKSKKAEKRKACPTALSELPSQNYTPLPCNRLKQLNCKRFVFQLITGQLRRLNLLLHGNTKQRKKEKKYAEMQYFKDPTVGWSISCFAGACGCGVDQFPRFLQRLSQLIAPR